jgi:hypothetical protein
VDCTLAARRLLPRRPASCSRQVHGNAVARRVAGRRRRERCVTRPRSITRSCDHCAAPTHNEAASCERRRRQALRITHSPSLATWSYRDRRAEDDVRCCSFSTRRKQCSISFSREPTRRRTNTAKSTHSSSRALSPSSTSSSRAPVVHHKKTTPSDDARARTLDRTPLSGLVQHETARNPPVCPRIAAEKCGNQDHVAEE